MNSQDRPLHQGYGRTPPAGLIYTANLAPRGVQMNSQPISQPPTPSYVPPGHMYAQGRLQSPYPNPSPRRNYAKVVALVALALSAVGLLVIGLLVLVVVGVQRSNRLNTDVAEAVASVAVAAVCQPGSYGHARQRDAPTFQGATDTAVCTAKVSALLEAPVPTERYGPIWIAEFSSSRAARDEATRENLVGATAIATIDGKAVLAVAPADWAGVSLEPLAQFGFVITPTR
jgi:hypothetical protein